MNFDFSKITDRRNTYSAKWDVAANELPLTLADMDFETAPAIVEALNHRMQNKIFGYTLVPPEYYEAVGAWWKSRHGLQADKDWILFCTGVIPAISSIVRKLTSVGENVLIQPPVYNIFRNSIVNNGRNIVTNNLLYEDGVYRMDFEDLKQKLRNPQTTMMILCNPHNPVGKVWARETLSRVGELCAKHHVLVLSDEIHCDLTHPGVSYTPFASVSQICADNSISCVAPTKTFNLAGLHSSSIIVPDPVLRHKVNRAINTDEVAEPNAFAMAATIAAYRDGGEWLDALRRYILENKETAIGYIHQYMPGLRVISSEATYLMWIDCSQYAADAGNLCDFIRRETGLLLTGGSVYGGNGGHFVRMNVACPRERLLDALKRLYEGIRLYAREQ